MSGTGRRAQKGDRHLRSPSPHKQRTRHDTELGEKNRSRAAGFTLIELAIVVLLLGLFAGLSMPMLLNFGQDDLRASARRLSGTVKYLYNEAALTGLEHRLVFNLAEGSYYGQVVDRKDEIKELTGIGGRHSLAGDARFRDIYQPRRGTRNSGEVTTALLPGGWLEETVIHLAMPDGENLTLRLVPLTGTTEFFDGYREFEEAGR
ncbi:hypothetical protein C2E25_10410 [Geothermobacter hydrogeniphilus]|uniref:General secretion pathway protein H n=1 Tax=Geothermobacter hydrogeniphilus TaxID=1969733 RepID=A0A2K2H951_9BACT|nr:prepilin-type N-terminal cleavage/methylation domain-containing protein [Geothermobacter hydrogeniphilus]PNU19836.1 hypothetical protein C2E25_10410 [Geothermobacter hydrogeniphilus]